MSMPRSGAGSRLKREPSEIKSTPNVLLKRHCASSVSILSASPCRRHVLIQGRLNKRCQNKTNSRVMEYPRFLVIFTNFHTRFEGQLVEMSCFFIIWT